MFHSLEFSLIFCLFVISGKGWAKKFPPKNWNESVVASFSWKYHPWCNFYLMKNERLECEIKVFLGYYYFSTSYVKIIIEATIYRSFSYTDVGVIFEKYILSRSHDFSDAYVR